MKTLDVFVASNGAERAPHVTWQQNDVGPRDEIARILNGADCDQRSLQLPADSSDLRVTCAGCIKLMQELDAERKKSKLPMEQALGAELNSTELVAEANLKRNTGVEKETIVGAKKGEERT